MTQLSEKDHKAQMAAMKAFDEQMPCIGIFWYDPEVHALCDVHKKELTPGMIDAAAKKGIHYIEYSPSGDVDNDRKEFSILNCQLSIASAFAGRIAWNIDKFIVLVGHWAEPILDELTELLEQEFSLPYFEFVYDEHWDLGHGWSGDMPK